MRVLGAAVGIAAIAVFVGGAACTSLDGLAGGSPNADAGDALVVDDAPDVVTPDADDAEANRRDAVAAACADAATVFCNRLAVCDPAAVQVLFGGPSVCTAQATLLCTTEGNAPGATLTAAEVTACSEATAVQTCSERLDGKKPAACEHKGSLEEGASCIGDAQCATGYCAGLGVGCGKCRIAAGDGQPCGTGCARGLRCIRDVCAAPRGLKEPCEDGSECGRAFQCVSEQCVGWLQEGDACASLGAPLGCDPMKTLACSSSMQRCAKAPVVQPGAECTVVDGMRALCAGGSCLPDHGGISRCTALATLGDPCTDRACVPPLWCIAGECVVPSPSLCAN